MSHNHPLPIYFPEADEETPFQVPVFFTDAVNEQVRSRKGKVYEVLVKTLCKEWPQNSSEEVELVLGACAWPPIPPETVALQWPVFREGVRRIPCVLAIDGVQVPIYLLDAGDSMKAMMERSDTRVAIMQEFGGPQGFRNEMEALAARIGRGTERQAVDSLMDDFVRKVHAARHPNRVRFLIRVAVWSAIVVIAALSVWALLKR